MQNLSKVQRLIAAILNIIVLAFIIGVSNFTYAQQLHDQTLYEITRRTPTQAAHFTVGKIAGIMYTGSIGVDAFTNTIYVVNEIDNSVYVIDGTTHTVIGKPIPVGKDPIGIDVDERTNTIYVTNYGDNTVSVINGITHTVIGKPIPVGKHPVGIVVDILGNIIYVTNSDDNTVSVINGTTYTVIGKPIPVGKGPGSINIDGSRNTIYVTNSENNTVSVINGTTYTVIGKPIPVGKGPGSVDILGHTIYVANARDNTVSVIDGKTHTVIGKPIPVGETPLGIGVNYETNTIYVINANDNTVSVIDGKTHTVIGKPIPVAEHPRWIRVNLETNTIYVATGRQSISVIDGAGNKVVARVMFNIKPVNSGYVVCDNTTAKGEWNVPIQQQFYIYSGSGCTAKPYPGFEFLSWEENLSKNSTQLINATTQSSVLDPVLDFFHMNPAKPESKLSIGKFGNFTANFKALTPPIPPEYVATLFTVVATAFIGSWLTPTVIAWRNARKQGSKLDHYHNEIKKVYNDGKIDENDIIELNKLRGNITHEYTRGNINNEYYTNLKDEISIVYEEIFKKRIDSLKNLPENDKGKLLVEIKDDIDDAYSKQKISELHYSLLKERYENLHWGFFAKSHYRRMYRL